MADEEEVKEKRRLAAEKRRQKLLERGSNRLAFVTGETKNLDEGQGKPRVKRKNSAAKAVAAEVDALMPEEEQLGTGSVVEEAPDRGTAEPKRSTPAARTIDTPQPTAEHSATHNPTIASQRDVEEVSGPQSSGARTSTRSKTSQPVGATASSYVNVLGASRLVLVVALAVALGSRGVLWSLSKVSDRWMREALSQPILLQFLFLNSGSLLAEVFIDSAGTPQSLQQRGAGKIISRAGKGFKFVMQTLDAGALFFFVYILTMSIVSVLLELQFLSELHH